VAACVTESKVRRSDTRLGDWSHVMGCPKCRQALGTVHEGGVGCTGCGTHYPVLAQIPRLLPACQARAFAQSSHLYRKARLRDGWRPVTPEQALALPFGSPPGYSLLYWQVRRQSYRRLRRFLADEGPKPDAGPVADLGSGTGWLAYRLAQEGYRVLAVDASLDDVFGLGAAQPYVLAMSSLGRLFLAQGDLEHPPLQDGCWSLVVFGASLHYASDLESTLCRAVCALQPRGTLVVLDTPIAPYPVPGTGRGDRHLGRQELSSAMTKVGLCVRWLSVPRSPRWWMHRVKAYLKRDAQFSFPLVVGRR
jgi:SAM-dependent methyltransferase